MPIWCLTAYSGIIYLVLILPAKQHWEKKTFLKTIPEYTTLKKSDYPKEQTKEFSAMEVVFFMCFIIWEHILGENYVTHVLHMLQNKWT